MRIFEDDEIIEITIKPSRLPSGSIIRKKTGSTPYTLIREIRVWPTDRAQKKEGEKPQIIKGLFLEGRDGNFNQIDPETDVVWFVNAYDLRWQLERDMDYEDK